MNGDFAKSSRGKAQHMAFLRSRHYLRGTVLISQVASQNSMLCSSPAGMTWRTLRPKAFEAGIHGGRERGLSRHDGDAVNEQFAKFLHGGGDEVFRTG
ncbi:MAG: hypothetical protein NTW71_12415 [Deltaproteobacteria bacterium]|nr:hypothetical protein [Deltaproteobacteria bacterium]